MAAMKIEPIEPVDGLKIEVEPLGELRVAVGGGKLHVPQPGQGKARRGKARRGKARDSAATPPRRAREAHIECGG